MNDLFTKNDYSLYSNGMTFMRSPYNADPIDTPENVVILGVPSDLATSGRPGARLGPEAIRKASLNLVWEEKKFPWDFSLRERAALLDIGDVVFDYGDAEDFTYRLEDGVSDLVKANKFVVALGGDHYMTLPILRACTKHFGEMALIHFGAHTNNRVAGSTYDHRTIFHHAPQEGLISPKHTIQVGIRTAFKAETHPFNVINAMEANELSTEEIAAQIHAVVGDKPTYVTFDIGCLDPAYAPGTGAPAIGGLTTDKVLKVIRELRNINIVGLDITEVSPPYDTSEITSLAAATIGLEWLYCWASSRPPLTSAI
ncbi:agmatinase [Vibrio palustris]|uniref:Agmatinase n=1 Tax=Vibrio palustris TaxID=1918946 RepID=A0A1R4B6M7_9VIBR|nr:agmatinase [Vibrio palustris]SJL84583.1 Agmatinase [Vibrio palustris]